jgi:hypothetical protein
MWLRCLNWVNTQVGSEEIQTLTARRDGHIGKERKKIETMKEDWKGHLRLN